MSEVISQRSEVISQMSEMNAERFCAAFATRAAAHLM
jgi:hypothetical protein